ncbi:acyl-CoA thioesterase [bacterium]|nr:acyl-CoA thioesterase [bacterium]
MAEIQNREVRRAEPLTMYEVVFPSDLNIVGTMFGGYVVALMDKCASMCAARWCKRVPVTASIDAIQFITPIRLGQLAEAVARIVYVGSTSCLAKVEVYAQDLQTADRFFCCEGYFTMVTLDANSKPVILPLIPVESEDEKRDWAIAAEIKEAMLRRRDQARSSQPL